MGHIINVYRTLSRSHPIIMRLLLTGDIHIGRSSTGLSTQSRRDDRRAAAAWKRIVDLAIEEEVDLVCLSGDIVDKDNKFWEAIGPLERGLKELSACSIRIVAVAGNHDYDVLARLSDLLSRTSTRETFRLLGRRGQWERITIEKDGRALHIDGWSFPGEHVYESPLETYDLESDSTTPVLGLVHGDLDVRRSSYAPLDTDRLLSAGPDAWLLGHIHTPNLKKSESGSWILYPGSPQALDFGEPGLHGVWILEVDHRIGLPELRPISTARYDFLTVDVTGTVNESDIERTIVQTIRRVAGEYAEAGAPHLRSVALRMNVSGRTAVAPRLEDVTTNLVNDLTLPVGAAAVEIDRLRISALPDIDLHEYAGSQSAPGALARLLLALDESDPSAEVADLIVRTKRELAGVERDKHFAALEEREITDEMARAVLRDQASELLTELIQQAA